MSPSHLPARAETRLRAALADDPLLEPVVELTRTDQQVRRAFPALNSFLMALASQGRGLGDATPDDVGAWLRGLPKIRKDWHGALQAVARGLSASGALPADFTRGISATGHESRDARRLTPWELEALLGPIRASAKQGDLVARRDMVLVGLCMWRPMHAPELTGITWGDVARDAGVTRRFSRATLEGGDIPASVAGWIDLLAARLADHGVEVVGDDALLMALGNRIYFDWMGRDRSLLAPLTPSGVSLALKRRIAAGRIDRSRHDGCNYVSPLAFLRAPEELDAALAGPAAPRRIAVRSTHAVEAPASRRTHEAIAA